MDQAYAIIDQEKRSTLETTDAFRCLQSGILDACQDQPQPMYKSATNPNCTRSFSDNMSILMLFRPARKVLTQGAGWLEFDLKSAQLAICATDWNIPMVQDFLRYNSNGIWKDLARHFATELTPALKDVFKDNLYAVLFGADKRWVKSEVTKQTGIKKAGDLFCSHPIVAAMLEMREQRLDQIRSDGGAENCFGMWVPIPKNDNGKPNPRSVLAVLAQARELQLLYPAFELAINTAAYDITLYQHDGFCMAVKDKSRTDKAVREVTQAVQRKADELSIATYLEQDS